METLLGVLIWGVLAVAVIAWLVSLWGGSGGASSSPPSADGAPSRSPVDRPTPPAPPNARPVPPVLTDETQREDEALVDGFVIGHFLTREHYERELDELSSQLDEVRDELAGWEWDPAGDDDLGPFDPMDDLGVEPWSADVFALEEDES